MRCMFLMITCLAAIGPSKAFAQGVYLWFASHGQTDAYITVQHGIVNCIRPDEASRRNYKGDIEVDAKAIETALKVGLQSDIVELGHRYKDEAVFVLADYHTCIAYVNGIISGPEYTKRLKR